MEDKEIYLLIDELHKEIKKLKNKGTMVPCDRIKKVKSLGLISDFEAELLEELAKYDSDAVISILIKRMLNNERVATLEDEMAKIKLNVFNNALDHLWQGGNFDDIELLDILSPEQIEELRDVK